MTLVDKYTAMVKVNSRIAATRVSLAASQDRNDNEAAGEFRRELRNLKQRRQALRRKAK